MESHWIEVGIYIITALVSVGIFLQKQNNHERRITKLEQTHDELHQDHRKIELAMANAPTKQDFERLSKDIQGLQLALVRLEMLVQSLSKDKSDGQ